MLMFLLRLQAKSQMPCLSRLLPGRTVLWMVCIQWCIWTVQQSKYAITTLSSTNPSIWLQGLTYKVQGRKELLGIWIAQNEGTKFWLGIITELQTREVNDILIACANGLKGFPETISTVYPNQLCIVYMVRNTKCFVSWKNYKDIKTDFHAIYQASTDEAAQNALQEFAIKWDHQYLTFARSWQEHWTNLNTIFTYPPQIKRPSISPMPLNR